MNNYTIRLSIPFGVRGLYHLASGVAEKLRDSAHNHPENLQIASAVVKTNHQHEKEIYVVANDKSLLEQKLESLDLPVGFQIENGQNAPRRTFDIEPL